MIRAACAEQQREGEEQGQKPYFLHPLPLYRHGGADGLAVFVQQEEIVLCTAWVQHQVVCLVLRLHLYHLAVRVIARRDQRLAGFERSARNQLSAARVILIPELSVNRLRRILYPDHKVDVLRLDCFRLHSIAIFSFTL